MKCHKPNIHFYLTKHVFKYLHFNLNYWKRFSYLKRSSLSLSLSLSLVWPVANRLNWWIDDAGFLFRWKPFGKCKTQYLESVVRPTAKLHVAVLVVEGEPGDVNLAGGFEDAGRDVSALAGVGHHDVGGVSSVEGLVSTEHQNVGLTPHALESSQCDQMGKLFVQYLDILNNEN